MKRFFLVAFFIFSCLWPEKSFSKTTPSELVKAVLSLEDPSVQYESGYQKIEYPMGDVPKNKGVCSDVIIRAYRLVGIDLQQLVHEDMKASFKSYPSLWGLTAPDKNIDHRRVPNLEVFFQRHGQRVKISDNPNDYRPGDIVTWNLREKGSLPHIGVVTDQYLPGMKTPLIMHNIGSGQVIEDILFEYKITGHYRYGFKKI